MFKDLLLLNFTNSSTKSSIGLSHSRTLPCVREQQERSLSFGVCRVCVAACQVPHRSVGGLLLV